VVTRIPYRLVLVVALAAGTLTSSAAPTRIQRILMFETDNVVAPYGWEGNPEGTIFLDGEVVHGGDWSVRIERNADSPGEGSLLTREQPLGVAGRRLELRAWVRLEDVDGEFALWMEQAYSNGHLLWGPATYRPLSGTTDWSYHVVELPVHDQAELLRFGGLLMGTGKVWLDDLDLRVDGELIEFAPLRKHETILDTDTQFALRSGIDLGAPNATQLESLVVLGKIWGFLKYHHPRVAAGELHWDFELFRVMPSVLAANDASARNAAIFRWVERIGPVTECQDCATARALSDVQMHSSIGWINDEELLGPHLCRALQHVYRNRPTGPQFWVGKVTGHRNGSEYPEFSREPAYAHLADVDTGYRILAAFRFWSIIEYWFPHRELIGENWDDVLHELLPVFVEASDRDAYRRALMQLVARVRDSHAKIGSAPDSRPPVGPCGLPFDFRFIEGQALVTHLRTAATDEGFRVGDIILTLDNRTIGDLVEEWSPYYGASNEPARLRDVAMFLSRGKCGPVTATVDRDGQRLDMQLERVADWWEGHQFWYDRPGEVFQLLGDDVAFLNSSPLKTESIRGYLEAALDKRGLIIDIRNYPSDDVTGLGRYFIDEPTSFARITVPDLENPGTFMWGPREVGLSPREPRYHGKVVILVNEDTQSAAEKTSMAFRAAGALVVGSTTAGADGNMTRINLPGGEWTSITGVGVFYPDGRPTQRIGIVPDIVVTPTREGVLAGRDEVLERALREILGPELPDLEIRKLAARPAGE
jgi:hypothetical protein